MNKIFRICLLAPALTFAGTTHIPNVKDFNNKVAKMNQCNQTKTTDCDGIDMSNMHWSDDPKQYQNSIDSNMSTQSYTVSAPIPTQQYRYEENTSAPHYQQTTSSPTINSDQNTNNDAEKNNTSQNSFIIS